MTQSALSLHSYANIKLINGAVYLPSIIDRLKSYEANYEISGPRHVLHYAIGSIELNTGPEGYLVSLRSNEELSLNRLKDLAAVAIKLYTKEEAPEFLWEGDHAGEQALPQFRQMRVIASEYFTPHMLRVRLAGEDLRRFALFGAMHVRLLLPTSENPEPVWPVMGPNGLPFWPDEAKKPAGRAYTIRNLNVDEGWIDIDFYMHQTVGLACTWAKNARIGDVIGIMGPAGRPLRHAKQYLIGGDATALPAIGRMLEEFEPDVTGHVVIAVDAQEDIQPLKHPAGVTIEWIVDANQADAAAKLIDRLCALPWPEGNDSFGWFAAEAEQAKIMRDYWRKQYGKTRDQTLIAGYWQKDTTGFMAG